MPFRRAALTKAIAFNESPPLLKKSSWMPTVSGAVCSTSAQRLRNLSSLSVNGRSWCLRSLLEVVFRSSDIASELALSFRALRSSLYEFEKGSDRIGRYADGIM